MVKWLLQENNEGKKERGMQKWLTGLLAALLLAVLTLPVMASDGIDARLNRQQERINELANSGQIAPKERAPFGGRT